mmetsp:Transcript_6681/g.8445  ORF Transcript_6681/g.8445 Transcript_6681/m.8445 type:complete len:303 (-) Transcript_6681:163-1071(-)
MKITALFALLALNGAHGFTVPAPTTFTSALKATREEVVNGVRVNGINGTSRISQAAPFSGTSTLTNASPTRSTKELFKKLNAVKVQGGSLRTCSLDKAIERVDVILKTEGRPLNANVELWQGPDNTPMTIAVYLEDGNIRPFRATIDTPNSSNAIAIRNTGEMEFPLTAALDPDMRQGSPSPSQTISQRGSSRIVQGGAVYTTPFEPVVQSVQICLKTDGRPMNARVELLQGPNNNKQVLDIYCEDGKERAFFAIMDTPGSGNVIRIVNTATVEFPLNAIVEPYIVDRNIDSSDDGSGMSWS